MKHKIKTVTACYTGGGIYIYYGQLESGLYFRADDECEAINICNDDPGTEEAQYLEWQELHTVEELTESDYRAFWNAMLLHVIDGKPSHDRWSNYLKSDLEERIIK